MPRVIRQARQRHAAALLATVATCATVASASHAVCVVVVRTAAQPVAGKYSFTEIERCQCAILAAWCRCGDWAGTWRR